jgi:hypothetical protein
MRAAAKHEARSEAQAVVVAATRGMLGQARAAETERARVAAEAAAEAAAVVVAAERLQLEQELAALKLMMQVVQAQLGGSVVHRRPTRVPQTLPGHLGRPRDSHLLVQVLQLASRQLQASHLRQHGVPSPVLDVGHERLDTIHRVQRHLRRDRERVRADPPLAAIGPPGARRFTLSHRWVGSARAL